MGEFRKIDPALARVVEALADLMAERDVRQLRAGLNDANNNLRPLFERPSEPALHC